MVHYLALVWQAATSLTCFPPHSSLSRSKKGKMPRILYFWHGAVDQYRASTIHPLQLFCSLALSSRTTTHRQFIFATIWNHWGDVERSHHLSRLGMKGRCHRHHATKLVGLQLEVEFTSPLSKSCSVDFPRGAYLRAPALAAAQG